MGKNSFKQYDQQGINLQSIQTIHTAQDKKKKLQANQKMGRRPKQTFLQRSIDGQEVQEKMFNIVNY